MTFAERFKYLRTKLRGWTQEEAAENLGVSRSTIAGYESKNRVPREDMLKKIADEFKVSVDYLLGHCDNNESDNIDWKVRALKAELRVIQLEEKLNLIRNIT